MDNWSRESFNEYIKSEIAKDEGCLGWSRDKIETLLQSEYGINFKMTSSSQGKVRDVYKGMVDNQSRCIIITTDRVSAFDYSLGSIPRKGFLLHQISQWWFTKLMKSDIKIQTHFLQSLDSGSLGSRAMVCQTATPIMIEFVVRGYLTGSSPTSIWTHYQRGSRVFCGQVLPDGMTKHQKLDSVLVTPTTKDEHDVNISGDEIVTKGILTRSEWEWCHDKSLELFQWGSAISREKGLILVDTKYEFGRLPDGTIILIDEIHTPDSSRFWIEESLPRRLSEGLDPDNLNKEFLRLWIKKNRPEWLDDNFKGSRTLPDDIMYDTIDRYIKFFYLLI